LDDPELSPQAARSMATATQLGLKRIFGMFHPREFHGDPIASQDTLHPLERQYRHGL
jgi:hypothetical protein